MGKYSYHPADSRGKADHGWLKSFHTFSFASYHNEERIHFGALRVLNDDSVAAGMGFGTHPHDNMEIVSIPLSGDLAHKDSMGNVQVIRQNDVQIMSAGTGISHSEFNHSKEEEVKFLQIWVFPKERNIAPRYEQKTFAPSDRHNKLVEVVAPDNARAVWINQDARFLLGDFEANRSLEYNIKTPGNGVYVFVLDGNIKADNQELNTRDGLAISESTSVKIETKSSAKLLLIEVPMLN